MDEGCDTEALSSMSHPSRHWLLHGDDRKDEMQITIQVLRHDLDTDEWEEVEERPYRGDPLLISDEVVARFGEPVMPALSDIDGPTVAIGWVFDDPAGARSELVVVPRARTSDGDWWPLHLLLARQRREFEEVSRDEGIDLHVVEYGGDDEEGPARCPRCRSPDLRPIVRGMPGPELVEAADRGEAVIGGCVVGDLDPTWRCGGCGVDLHELGDGLVPDDLVATREGLPGLVERLVDWQVDNLDRQQGVGVHLATTPDVFVQWVAAEAGRGARMEVSAAAVDFDALRSGAVTICEGVFEDLPPDEPLVGHPDVTQLVS